MNLDQFISKYQNKSIDFDGAYSGQCVDLYRQYVKEVLGKPQSPGVTGAADIWTSYLADHFDKVPNTPEGVPAKGDIVIWNRKYGPFGHVAVVVSADANKMSCFSQNDPPGALCILKDYTYKNIYGWLHPKGVVENMADITISQKTFEELVSKASKYDGFMSSGWGTPDFVNQTIEDYKKQLEGVRNERDTANQTVEARRKEWNELVANLAQSLNTRQDPQEIKNQASLVGNISANYEDLQAKYSKDRAAWATVEQELKAEIARMDAIIKQTNILENLTAEQIFIELLKRLRKLLRLV